MDFFWGVCFVFLRNGGCFSVTKSCPILCTPMDYSMPGFPVLHCLLEFAQTNVHWVGEATQRFHPLLNPSPPALNLSQYQVFSSELALCIRWPKYWNFSISPSNEYSGLISFRIDCPRDSQESSPAPLRIFSLCLSFFLVSSKLLVLIKINFSSLFTFPGYLMFQWGQVANEPLLRSYVKFRTIIPWLLSP